MWWRPASVTTRSWSRKSRTAVIRIALINIGAACGRIGPTRRPAARLIQRRAWRPALQRISPYAETVTTPCPNRPHQDSGSGDTPGRGPPIQNHLWASSAYETTTSKWRQTAQGRPEHSHHPATDAACRSRSRRGGATGPVLQRLRREHSRGRARIPAGRGSARRDSGRVRGRTGRAHEAHRLSRQPAPLDVTKPRTPQVSLAGHLGCRASSTLWEERYPRLASKARQREDPADLPELPASPARATRTATVLLRGLPPSGLPRPPTPPPRRAPACPRTRRDPGPERSTSAPTAASATSASNDARTCNAFCTRTGAGGTCPCCQEVITLDELLTT